MLLVGVLISVLFDELERWRDGTRRAKPPNAGTPPPNARCALGFAIALALLGAIGIVMLSSVVRLSENSHLVAHSQLVMANIDALVATTLETESAQARLHAHGRGAVCRRLHARRGTRRRAGATVARCSQHEPGATGPRRNRWPKPYARGWSTARELMELRRTGGLEAVQQLCSRRTARGPASSLQGRVRDARAAK